MKKINLKKILSLILCLMLIAPVFTGYYGDYNIVSANNSAITTFSLFYNGANVLANANSRNITVRASTHMTKSGGVYTHDPAKPPININLQNIRMGSTQDVNATWKAVLVNPAGAIVMRDTDVATPASLFRTSSNTDMISIYPNDTSVGDTIILEVWVTQYGIANGDIIPDVWPPQRDNILPQNDRLNFRIETVMINIVDDDEHGTLGANFFEGNTQINTTRMLDITPAASRTINIRNVFAYDFNLPSHQRTVSNFQWRIEFIEGESIEIAIGDRTVTNSMPQSDFFTQASQRNMIVRARRPTGPGAELRGNNSGGSSIRILIREPASTDWQPVSTLHFDVTAAASFDIQPILISPPTLTANLVANDAAISVPSFRAIDSDDDPYDGQYVRIPLENMRIVSESGVPYTTLSSIWDNLGGDLTATVSVARNTIITAATMPPESNWSISGNNITRTFPIIENNVLTIGSGIGAGANGDIINLYIPLNWLPATGNPTVTITLNGNFYSAEGIGTKIQTFNTSVTIRRVIEGQGSDGDFVSFGFTAGHADKDDDNIKGGSLVVKRDTAAANVVETLTIEMDRNGDFITTDPAGERLKVEGSNITLDDFKAIVYAASDSTLMRDSHDYRITNFRAQAANQRIVTFNNPFPTAADTKLTLNQFLGIDPVVTGGTRVNFSELTLTGNTGTVTIVLNVEPIKQGGTTGTNIAVSFNIRVNQVGVFEDDEGNVDSVSIGRIRQPNNRRSAIPTAIDEAAWNLTNERIPGSVFLKSEPVGETADDPPVAIMDSMTVNINSVRVADSKASGFTRVSNNFNAYIRVVEGDNFIKFGGNSTVFTDFVDTTPPAATYLSHLASPPSHRLISTAASGVDFTITVEEAINPAGGEAIIEVTIVPMTGAGINRQYAGAAAGATGGNKPLTVYFRVVVNELGANFALVPDDEKEVLMIKLGSADDDYYTFDNAVGIEYMYALRAVQHGSSQKNERWLPMMGSEINISGLIPRSGQYRIAVRLAEAAPDEDGDFTEDNRQMIELGARIAVSTNERRRVSYRNGVIRIDGNSQEVLYRVAGISQWTNAVLTPEGGIAVSPEHFPLGGTLEIRFLPDDDSDRSFASPVFRVRVPRAGRTPRIRENERRRTLNGFTVRMSWSIGPASAVEPENSTDGWQNNPENWMWTTCPKGAVTYGNLATTFGGLQSDGNGFRNLYIRTNATNKNPPSAPMIFKIREEVYNTPAG